MKTDRNNQAGFGANLKKACAACYQRITAGIKAAKESIFVESAKRVQGDERLLRLALNEAEATAFQTLYPHLVFPTLAMENVQAVVDWHQHQRNLNPAARALAWAA